MSYTYIAIPRQFGLHSLFLQPPSGIRVFIEFINIGSISEQTNITFEFHFTTLDASIPVARNKSDLAEINVSYHAACERNYHSPGYNVFCLNGSTEYHGHENTNTSCPLDAVAVQLVMGCSLLVVFIVTAIVLLLWIKRKMRKHTQFSYVKYIRQNAETNCYNKDTSTSLSQSGHTLQVPEVLVETNAGSNSAQPSQHEYSNLFIPDTPYTTADTALPDGRLDRNISYNSMDEGYGCEPCPAYRANML